MARAKMRTSRDRYPGWTGWDYLSFDQIAWLFDFIMTRLSDN